MEPFVDLGAGDPFQILRPEPADDIEHPAHLDPLRRVGYGRQRNGWRSHGGWCDRLLDRDLTRESRLAHVAADDVWIEEAGEGARVSHPVFAS